MSKRPDNKKTLLDWALEYYQCGWSIIPIGFGKKPPKGFKWKKYQKTRATEAQLREWFGNGRYKSLAVICGDVSGGLVVLDLDSEQRCDWWRRERPKSTETLPMVETQKGRHIYFRAEPFPKRNGDDVDLLCEGAYAVLPPSPNKEWIIPLNGELPLLNPFEWGLEQFGISSPQKKQQFTEEIEETDDIEEIEDIKEIEAISCGCVVYSELESRLKSNVDDAIKNTLPDNRGYRNFLIFQFCRWLKGVEEFERLPAKALKDIVRVWHKQALPYIETKPFDETWSDFAYGWPRVKYPKGDGMLKLATQRALKTKTKLVVESQYDAPETQLLIRVCYELQKLRGTKSFWLSCYDAGGILGLSHTEANKRLQMLVADEILRIIEKNTTKRATRYRYIAN